MRMRLTVTGDKELMRHIRQLGPKAAEAGKDVLKAAVKEMVPKIKAQTPVSPKSGGELRQSIRAGQVRHSKKTGRITASVIAGGPKTEEPGKKNVYATVQEVGQAVIHGKMVHFSHSVGQSPYMAQEVFKVSAKIPGRLKAKLDRELKP